MLDTFRTLLARFMVSHLTRPRPLVIRPWLWLAAEADEIGEKRHCLNAVLEIDPGTTSALLALIGEYIPNTCSRVRQQPSAVGLDRSSTLDTDPTRALADPRQPSPMRAKLPCSKKHHASKY